MPLATAHTVPFDFWIWFGRNWWWVIWLTFVFVGSILETFTKGVSHALRTHHKRKIELEAIRIEQEVKRGQKHRTVADVIVDRALEPSRYIPLAEGPCKHRRILPVLNKDGDLLAWLCQNPHCSKQLPPSAAVYEEDA
jgi:hypothetical protein